VVVAKRTVFGWFSYYGRFGPYVLWSWLGCWRQVVLVPMVNKDPRDLQAPMVNKDLRVQRGLRDLQAPMVNKDLRVQRGLRDRRAIPETLDRRDRRDRVAQRMVRHARMRPALLEPWFQVPTPRVCSLRTA
jgi:hypothetical protein